MTLTSMKSMGAGIGGVIILSLFCSTFMAMEKVLFIIPLFIGFTGAMTGFQLVEILTERIRGHFIFPFALSMADLLIYMMVSGITSVLGARLAVRYFNL